MIQAGVQAIQTGAGQVVLAPAGSYEELSESEAAAEQIEEAFGWGFDDAVEAAIHAPRFDELIEATSYLYDYVPVRRSLDNTLPQCQLCGGPRGKILSTGFSGDVPEGEFFSSPLMRASIRRDLGDNVFGQIDLSGLPFGVEISGKHGRGRGQVALAHEFLHMADAMLKTGIPHDKIPPLATLLGTEGFAAYDAYRRHVGN